MFQKGKKIHSITHNAPKKLHCPFFVIKFLENYDDQIGYVQFDVIDR